MLDRIGVDRQAAGTWDAERELSGAELPERRPARRGPTEVRVDGAVNLRQSSAAVRTRSDLQTIAAPIGRNNAIFPTTLMSVIS
jgi:hypothetical protein